MALELAPFCAMAVTVITLAPDWSEMGPVVQLVEPDASPLAPRELDQSTRAIPEAADAVPERATAPVDAVQTPFALGAVMSMRGAPEGWPDELA